MPALSQTELVRAVLAAISDSGFSGITIPSVGKPKRIAVTGTDQSFILTVYVWTLTFGGRPALAQEYRIQMTSVQSPLQIAIDGPTVLLGYEPNLRLFSGFDIMRHRIFTTGSPSVQINVDRLREAEENGLSFHRKGNDEIAIGIRPDWLVTYSLNASAIHRYGREARLETLLNSATSVQPPTEHDLADLTRERRRLIERVSRFYRESNFKREVRFAYGNRCAVSGMQLGLIEAAHILPVGAPGSPDHVTNGIALSPTYHRAFDGALIYLDADLRMILNPVKVKEIAGLGLQGGLRQFRAPLEKRIFLPPDRNQWPNLRFINEANRYRRVG